MTERFATRVQYNADKELLFITVPKFLGREEEIVVEMEHIEIVVPYVNIGTKYLTANEEDGFIQIKDMNKNQTFILNKRKTYLLNLTPVFGILRLERNS